MDNNSITLLELEERTITNVSHTMSAIENALAVWDASKRKPNKFRNRILKLRRFYGQISMWEKEALKNKEHRDLIKCMKRLKRFNEICIAFKKRG